MITITVTVHFTDHEINERDVKTAKEFQEKKKPVERDFSVATHVLGKTRLSMAPARLEQLVFTKRNAKSLNFDI